MGCTLVLRWVVVAIMTPREPTVTGSVVNADSKIDLHATLDKLQHTWNFNCLKRPNLHACMVVNFAISVHK